MYHESTDDFQNHIDKRTNFLILLESIVEWLTHIYYGYMTSGMNYNLIAISQIMLYSKEKYIWLPIFR